MATMRDVAQRAGVSLATVSFAINKTKPVAPSTRERIEAAMLELNYKPNAIARALASRRTRIIAPLFPVLEHNLDGTALKFFTSAAAEAQRRGYNLILWPSGTDAARIDQLVHSGLIDGVVVMEVYLHDERVERLRELGIPFTLIGRTAEPRGISYVDVNFEGLVATAMHHLRELGHRRIGIVFGEGGDPLISEYGPVVRTRDAYLAAIADTEDEPLMFSCDQSSAAGRRLVPDILRQAPDISALLLLNEHAASGIVSGLRAQGIGVPESVSVVGLGSSIEVAEAIDPQISLYESPSEELGRRGVEDLIDVLEGTRSAPGASLVDCVFVDFGSIAPAHS